MNMKNKNKTIILIIAVAIIASAIFFLFFNKEKIKYPKQPIEQKSLTTTDQNINLDKTDIDNDGDYSLWQISNSLKLSSVEKMVAELSNEFNLIDSLEGDFYQWSNGNDEVIYDLGKNYLIFSYAEGIPLDEAEITGNSFSNFVKKYFDQKWQYTVFKNEKGNNGETIYYAKRVLEDEFEVEIREHNQQTDSLALKDGKIIYGKILLTNFVESEISVPLISNEDLNKYLNTAEYPKEIYPQYGGIRESVLNEVDYLSEEFEELSETLDNCKSTSSEVIYLYKSFEQKLLTPIYKLEVQCEVTYKEQQYSIPAIAYVNAVDPEYLYVPE